MFKKLLGTLSLITALLVSARIAVPQTNDQSKVHERIIRAERPGAIGEDDAPPALQVLGLSIGDRTVEVNSVFAADNNWLKDLRINVKNISDKSIYCVGIAFGLLAEIDTKLRPHQSWPWGLGMYKGSCGDGRYTSSDLKFRLEPGEETVLEYRDIPQVYMRSMKDLGGLSKAVFDQKSVVGFRKRKPIEVPLAFYENARFLDDEPY